MRVMKMIFEGRLQGMPTSLQFRAFSPSCRPRSLAWPNAHSATLIIQGMVAIGDEHLNQPFYTTRYKSDESGEQPLYPTL